MKFSLGTASLPDYKVGNNTERVFGRNDPAGVVGTMSPDGKTVATVDQSKSSVKIEYDFKKLDSGGQDAPSEKTLFNHELGHGVDMAKDPVGVLNKTQGESETSAERFQEQVSKEKPDMSKEDAQKAVQELLNTPQEQKKEEKPQ